MKTIQVDGVRIAGVAASLPQRIESNRDSISHLHGDRIDAVIKATGIERRVLADPETTGLDLAVHAARKLVEGLAMPMADIGGIVYVTFTPEFRLPGDSSSAQNQLGLRNDTIALDLNLACAGYPYGLMVAGTITEKIGCPMLVLSSDVQSPHVSYRDRGTYPLMSDIGTATILIPSGISKPWRFSFFTDGSRLKNLFIPGGGGKCPVNEESLMFRSFPDGSQRRPLDIEMNGFEIFKFVSRDVTRFIRNFIERENIDLQELKAFVPHQANMYLVDQLAKELRIPTGKTWKSGQLYGNPASSSIPLTMAENASELDLALSNERILIAGFGAGLAIGVGSVSVSEHAHFEIVNYTNREDSM